MKASVQYNDLKGTSAADISDFHKCSLQNYLINSYEQYDGDRIDMSVMDALFLFLVNICSHKVILLLFARIK